MRGMITSERLAEQVCRTLDISAKDNAESLTQVLRIALNDKRDQAIGAAKTVCLEIAEDEAERCRAAGATAAQQTALTIAARIRRRHVELLNQACGGMARQVAMCPECGSAEVTINPYDFGTCPQTGYRDAGERFHCHACGAQGDAGDMRSAPLPVDGVPPLPGRCSGLPTIISGT